MQVRSDLDQFFHPDGVAILGRVDRDADPDELRRQMEERYAARFYLVNPKGGSVGGIHVYPSVLDIPDPVGLAVMNIAPAACAGAMEECGKKGIAWMQVYAGEASFKSTNEWLPAETLQREQRWHSAAKPQPKREERFTTKVTKGPKAQSKKPWPDRPARASFRGWGTGRTFLTASPAAVASCGHLSTTTRAPVAPARGRPG